MPHKIRKVRKQRGSRTYGWGQVGQHRAGGSRGGRGRTGMHKHKWTRAIKYSPNYFGKHGFKHTWGRTYKTMNIWELDKFVENLLTNQKEKRTEGEMIVNLSELSIDKLLGSGHIFHPLIVKAKSFSQIATKKIQEAGGQIVVEN